VWLPDGEKKLKIVLRLPVLTELANVTGVYRRTDGQTDTA